MPTSVDAPAPKAPNRLIFASNRACGELGMVRLVLAVLLAALLAVAGVVGYRSYAFSEPDAAMIEPVAPTALALDMAAASERLAAAIRFRTMGDDPAQFDAFHAWLAETYPAFHAIARRETVAGASLLYVWEGIDPAQPPLLLLAHQDVVPAPAETRVAWRVDPFAGVIADGEIWGRGTLDDKGSLVALMEAAEQLALTRFKPRRTIIFAFAHDEETANKGAKAMAALLQQRGQHAWFALDEGMAVTAIHPLTGGPVALIGVAEKGNGTLRISAQGAPGHSSTPPPDTAVSRLARAVSAVHEMPIERGIEGGPALSMALALSDHLPPMTRMALANEWLFGPLVRQRLEGDPAAAALMGTTIAPTMIEGGQRPNVLPGRASAMINVRLHPRDTANAILAQARAATAEIEGVRVDWAAPPDEASPAASTASSSYRLIAGLARGAFPDAPVAPMQVLGYTDGRNYQGVAENVYRFTPVRFSSDMLASVHGVNERISVDDYEKQIRFYIGLMQAGTEP